MGWMQKITNSGIGSKLHRQARRPENQTRLRSAVSSLRGHRGKQPRMRRPH